MNGSHVSSYQLQCAHQTFQIMDKTIMNARLSDNQHKLWEIQHDGLNKLHANVSTGKKRAITVVHPVLMSWCIACHACMLIIVCKEVQQVMNSPDTRHVQRETTMIVSRNAGKVFVICIVLMKSVSKVATKELRSKKACSGMVNFGSYSLNAGVGHDHVTYIIVGGNESHCFLSLSLMFDVLANNRNVAELEAKTDCVGTKYDCSGAKKKNSILDELPLTHECRVFKWTLVDPNVKYLEIAASTSVEKVTP